MTPDHDPHDEHKHDAHDEHAHDEHDEHKHDAHDEHKHDAHDEHAHDEHDEHKHDAHDEHAHDEHDEHEHDAHDHHHHPHAPSGITAAKPIFNVAHTAASLQYYIERLGFELVFAWCDETQADDPGVATFGEVRRGQAAVMLAQGEQGGPGMWIYLDVHSAAELKALHAEYVRKGALITAPPTDKPWGMREMLVQDLDGHTLRLGAPLEHE